MRSKLNSAVRAYQSVAVPPQLAKWDSLARQSLDLQSQYLDACDQDLRNPGKGYDTTAQDNAAKIASIQKEIDSEMDAVLRPRLQ